MFIFGTSSRRLTAYSAVPYTMGNAGAGPDIRTRDRSRYGPRSARLELSATSVARQEGPAHNPDRRPPGARMHRPADGDRHPALREPDRPSAGDAGAARRALSLLDHQAEVGLIVIHVPRTTQFRETLPRLI